MPMDFASLTQWLKKGLGKSSIALQLGQIASGDDSGMPGSICIS